MAKRAQEDDALQADYLRLQRNLSDAQEARSAMQGMLGDSRMAKVLGHFERDIETAKEYLVSAEKKDVDRFQAEVKARRGLLATLKGAYEHELDEATKSLAEFRKQNELFIQSISDKASTATAKSA